MINGHESAARSLFPSDNGEETEVLRLLRSLDERVGHSPDPATGYSGCGLCRAVTELQAESAFQARLRLEAAQRSERRAGWIKVAYYALGLSGMLIGAVLGGLKLLLLFAR